jgi:DNA-binding response OmpR family regulator
VNTCHILLISGPEARRFNEILERYFIDAGWRLSVAEDWEEGVAQARRFKPDVVVINVLAGAARGFEVCRRLYRDPGTSGIPVIFLARREGYDGLTGLHVVHAKRYLTLPVVRNEFVGIVRDVLAESGWTEDASPRAPHILVVEDDAMVREFITEMLEEMDFVVTTAQDGPDCIVQAIRLKPDAIVLNVMMPGLDGIEVCEQLRNTPETSGIPVILESAREDKMTMLRGAMAGADQYLKKPFSPDALVDAIRKAIEARRTEK